jgi:diguanylate cyclase (GGDEF)-like protein/PAS domain S-box-containing protein
MLSSEAHDRAHILIVDDVPANLVVLGNALSEEYDVRFATSGKEAIDLALASPPDLILLDVMMPGMSGHEVHHLLRQHPALRYASVIFVTADTSLDSEMEGFRLGADDYITKPIVVPILQARVKNVLERTLRRRELELALSSAEQGLWESRVEEEKVKFNAHWAIPLGYTYGEMSPCVMTWQHIVHPGDWPVLFAARDNYLHGRSGLFDPEIRMRTKNDTFCWMQLHGKAVEFDANGLPIKLVGTYMNISRRKQAELELSRREEQLATMITSLHDAVLVLDKAGLITTCHTPPSDQIHCLSPDVVGQHYAAALPAELARWIGQAMQDVPQRDNPAQTDLDLEQAGRRCCLNLTLSILAGPDGAPTGFFLVMQDITQRKVAEEEIRTLAFFDTLTKLPNQRLLRERLHMALDSCPKNKQLGALLLIDLDNLKRIERTHGYGIGEQLLIEMARRMQCGIDAGHTLSLVGDGQFLLLLENVGSGKIEAAQSARAVSEQIMTEIARSVLVAGTEFHLTASMGCVLFDGSHTNEDQLIQQAGLAMDDAKASPHHALTFFDPLMQASMLGRVEMEQAIYRGLQRGEFFLMYQPQVDPNGTIVGVEALVRWQHPEKGLVSPGQFIPIAEETELIVPLGKYLLEVAGRQLQNWQNNPATAGLTLAVNVSSRQFAEPNFVEDLELLIQTQPFNPALLKLEITESLLLENTDSVIEKMQRLRKLGVGFALDDFGTGYSSLIYLKKLPLDQLKIDQSFVRNALSNSVDAAIIRAIMALGNSLGIAIIAEGVETEAERNFLLQEGCRLFQGYYFGRPSRVEELQGMLAQSQTLPPVS